MQTDDIELRGNPTLDKELKHDTRYNQTHGSGAETSCSRDNGRRRRQRDAQFRGRRGGVHFRRPLHGQDAIRADIESFFNNTPEGKRDNFEVVRRDIDGDVAYITWKAEPFVLMATETFVVTDDKI